MRALRLLVLALALALAPIHAHADRGNYLRCVAFAVPRGVPASHRRLSRRSLCAAHVLFDAFRDETRSGTFHARTPPATSWKRPRRPEATRHRSRPVVGRHTLGRLETMFTTDVLLPCRLP
jgi:hypothetical protein